MTGASEYQGRSGPPHLMTRLVQSSSSTRRCIQVVKQHDQDRITHDDIQRLSKVATTPLQPQRLLEGFQRLAGSLNSLGNLFLAHVLLSRCLAGRNKHSESSLRFLQTLLLPPPTFPPLQSFVCSHVTSP
jgi:hypothetical protein